MTGIMLDDEGVFGSVHIGIGSNITLGGNIKAAIHYDLLMWTATIELDGKVILEKGDLKYKFQSRETRDQIPASKQIPNPKFK